jgi:large subunit ribosomal protein L19
MAIYTKHKETQISIGDRIKVIQNITEGDKKRLQAFEGLLIAIKGSKNTQTITVRRIGAGQIGIERIFALHSPTIEKIEVVRKGGRGVKRAKLYYVRKKSRKEVEKIYQRAAKKEISKQSSSQKKTSKKSKKKK